MLKMSIVLLTYSQEILVPNDILFSLVENPKIFYFYFFKALDN